QRREVGDIKEREDLVVPMLIDMRLRIEKSHGIAGRLDILDEALHEGLPRELGRAFELLCQAAQKSLVRQHRPRRNTGSYSIGFAHQTRGHHVLHGSETTGKWPVQRIDSFAR